MLNCQSVFILCWFKLLLSIKEQQIATVLTVTHPNKIMHTI